ncbi:MAG: sulfatase-like hydrolase/transferase [Gemmataceae bacterium]
MRIRTLPWALFVCVPFVALAPDVATADARRPNVLFLFTDDQRPDTIAALGNPHIITPNLDTLARSGFVFRNAYCMGANVGAVCLPSRNMLLSGRAYFRFDKMASGSDPNFPDSLKNVGYVTYHHGKIGNTAREIHQRFDHTKYLNDQHDRTCGEPGQQIVDDALTFLKDKQDDKPFFLYLAFANPHDPRVAADKYLKMYQRDQIPLPKNYMPLHPFDNGEMTIRDEKLAPWPRTEDVVRHHLHDYYATITAMDHHIGRLLQYLKDTKQYDNTIIIFSSDHGLAIGSHGLFGKQNLYDHSMKAPLIFAGPGIPKGQSDALAYLLDIYPTVCDLVGAKIPARLDGQSLAPIMQGKQEKVRDSLFTSYREVMRSVRDDRWKLIRYPHINKTQLFDLRNDPDELRDLAADPSQAERIQHLMALLSQWQKKLGDKTPLTSDKPRDPTFTPPRKGE